MGFTNTTAGFLKKRPKTAIAAALILAAGISFVWKDSSENQIAILTDRGNLTVSGSILYSSGQTIGWTVQAGANTACSTT